MIHTVIRLPNGTFGLWSEKKAMFVQPALAHKRDLMRVLWDSLKKKAQPHMDQAVKDAEEDTKGREWARCLGRMEEVHGKDVRQDAERTQLAYRKWSGGQLPKPARGKKK